MLTRMIKRLCQVVAVSLIVFGMVAQVAAVDFSVPLIIESGGAETNLSFGISISATDGYDYGLDGPISPSLQIGESLNAYFWHPEWSVVMDGEAINSFYSDMRSAMPQEYYFEVDSLASQVTLMWSWDDLPERGEFWLYDHAEAGWIDMRAQLSYSFTAAGWPYGLTVSVSEGDVVSPGAPSGISHEGQGESLHLEWPQGAEEDIAGYKVHFGKESGLYNRTRDLRLVYNYTLKKLKQEQTYYIALTSYDTSGNESGYSTEIAYTVPKTTFRVYGVLMSDNNSAKTRDMLDEVLGSVEIRIKGNNGQSFRTVTAEDGTFEITGVPKGKYKLRIRRVKTPRNMRFLHIVNKDVYLEIRAKR